MAVSVNNGIWTLQAWDSKNKIATIFNASLNMTSTLEVPQEALSGSQQDFLTYLAIQGGLLSKTTTLPFDPSSVVGGTVQEIVPPDLSSGG